MSKVICHQSISLDGYSAGPNQTKDNPFGDGDVDFLHAWMFDEPETAKPVKEQMLAAGAFVMGRNMFGPIRGEWEGDWRGWWGEEPPYHAPVFVLTHYAREPVTMQGGTTFNFVTDGIESAIAQAREAAGDRNVSIAGGASTVSQALAAGAIDELHLQVAPFLLGAGERLFDGVPPQRYERLGEPWGTGLTTHLTYGPVQ